MNEKIKKYLDGIFLPYDEMTEISEMKEELYLNLSEKAKDYLQQGYNEETAYQKAINSLGEINELTDSIIEKTRELKQLVGMDFSKSNLKDSDFQSVQIHDGKFNYSDLKGSDFSRADLKNSTFKSANLENVRFDKTNLTGAKFSSANLKKATFAGAILDHTEFRWSDLSKVCFDNQTFNGTIFDYSNLKGATFRDAVFRNVSFKSEVKKAIFDGAMMDKVTYALLKGYKANLDKVTIIS